MHGGANIPATLARGRGLARVRVLLAIVVLAAIAALVGFVSWQRKVHDLERATRRGLERLAAARSTAEVRRGLADWERESGATLRGRRDDWISYVLSHYSTGDAQVRRLLAHVAGVNYGDRPKDWERWNDARRRMAKGQQAAIPQKERVELVERWRTAVGLTSFFSTIWPIDGRIYVASLGAKFDAAGDSADGIVRIDGRTGDAQIIFEAPDAPPRDILGIAYADGLLLAACRNGFVYCTDTDGKLRWKANAGAKLTSIPLALDANRDGTVDVVVVTVTGRVTAFSGNGGKTIWTTPVELVPKGFDADAATQSPEQAATRASLALGTLPTGGGAVLFVTTVGGNAYALTPASGKIVWHQRIDGGLLAGAVCVPATPQSEATLVAGDTYGRIWSLVRAARSCELETSWGLEHAADSRIVASPRTIAGTASAAAPQIVACTAGDPGALGGSIFRLSASGAVWRFTPGGAIWASPAIADVNGDGKPEVVVASSSVTDGGEWWAWLSVVSEEGHLLRHVWIDAAVECPPVVADVDGDGTLEILVADRSGLLHCIDTKKSGPVEWGLAAGDPRNSRNAVDAYSFGQTPVGKQGRWRPK